MSHTTDTCEANHDAMHPPAGVPGRDEFDAWTKRMAYRFVMNTKGLPMFTTDAADGLFDVYLMAMPIENRQYHTCNACRRFVEKFGSLVAINKQGHTLPVMWDEDDAPEYYRPAVKALIARVKNAKVTGVFVTSENVWGTPITGEWRHFGVYPYNTQVYRESIKTADQFMAEKLEDFKNVIRALKEFSEPVVAQALLLIRAEALSQAEKVEGPVAWLHQIIKARENTQLRHHANVVWLAIATAPAGFCHPRSSMAGTLLDDLASGMHLEQVKRRFEGKMHPLRYQRPQAAPTEGNIKRGEDIIERLGLAPALRRRYARPDDIVKLAWKPTAVHPQPSKGGVFGHLKPKNSAPEFVPNGTPATNMTWEKFARTVLPAALSIDVFVPSIGNFAAMVTAEDQNAAPIIQWDREEQRNPVSWYVWNGGSPAHQWGLTAGSWAPLWGITHKPSSWFGEFTHQGNGVLFLIKDAKETRVDGGLALFPSVVRSELHEIRATIEAFSRAGTLGNAEGPHAAGLLFSGVDSVQLCVSTLLGVAIYRLDRWD